MPRAPVYQRVETVHRYAPQQRLVIAVSFRGIDDVVTVIDPVTDKLLDQISRMLAIAVHEQDSAAGGMIQPRHQRGLLAEIAR
jgi:hypothetical protein